MKKKMMKQHTNTHTPYLALKCHIYTLVVHKLLVIHL